MPLTLNLISVCVMIRVDVMVRKVLRSGRAYVLD